MPIDGAKELLDSEDSSEGQHDEVVVLKERLIEMAQEEVVGEPLSHCGKAS